MREEGHWAEMGNGHSERRGGELNGRIYG